MLRLCSLFLFIPALFAEQAKRFADAVEAGERAWIVARFQEVARYFAEFAAWGKQESDAILADIVRHG